MLYQTPPHPLLFQFHPFPSPFSHNPRLPLSTTPPPLHLQGETEMECLEVEGALKKSFRKDMALAALKLSPAEDLQNGGSAPPPCDDLFVDQLLDFSHVDEQQEPPHKNEGDTPSECDSPQSNQICKPLTPPHHHFASLPTTDLTLPDDDDVAGLEWLSHFVEDSFSEFSAAIPTINLTPSSFNLKDPATRKPDPLPSQPCFKTPVPAKARSKRTRTGVRVWPLGSPTFTDSSSTSTTTSSSSTSSSSPPPSSPLLIYATNFTQGLDHVSSSAAPPKKPKKKPSPDPAAGQAPRRCSHCGVQKTPQWRTGPLGAKTLCNACGVRFKSGRLLPEYRPACSPTFSSELHSNHHRKVLEMRRKKEETMDGAAETATGLAPPPTVVPSS